MNGIWDQMYEAAIRIQNPQKISDYVEAGQVAAAVLSSSGKIYTGVCVDTCSGLGICAERTAIFNMISAGEIEIRKVLAICSDGKTGAPCGACRELMVQLMPESYQQIEIMLDYDQGKTALLGDLTPEWWIPRKADETPLATAATSEEPADERLFDDANIGDLVEFGRWHGRGIAWKVLDIEPNRMLLVTNKAIACRQYHHVPFEGITWETCDLRTWLNGTFCKGAFDEEELAEILDTNVINDANSEYETDGGNDTQDKVFCLSIDEALIYWDEMKERVCYPTPHTKSEGVWTDEKGACNWWLRSPGSHPDMAAVVDHDGAIFRSGEGVAGGLDSDFKTVVAIETGVRPALWVRL